MNIIIGFLKKHYEKLILGFLLLIFIALLIFLAFLVRETREKKAASGTSINYTDAASKKKIAHKDEYDINKSLKFTVWEKKAAVATGKTATGKDAAKISAVDYTEDFVMPVPLTICPECRKAIPEADFKFPMDDGKYHCSLCRNALRPPMILVEEDEGKDTDKDGMPDQYEIRYQKYGYRIDDRFDADRDLDSDGFTNLEEYYCDMDPLNPKQQPSDKKNFKGRLPYDTLLKCINIEIKTYSFRVLSMNNEKVKVRYPRMYKDPRTGVLKKHPTRDNRPDLKAGQTFQSLDENIKVVSVSRNEVVFEDLYTGDKIRISNTQRNRDIVSPYPRAEIEFRMDLGPGKNKKVKTGDKISYGNAVTGVDEYTVHKVSTEDGTLELKNKDGKVIAIGKTMEFDKIFADNKAKKDARNQAGPKQREKIRE